MTPKFRRNIYLGVESMNSVRSPSQDSGRKKLTGISKNEGHCVL